MRRTTRISVGLAIVTGAALSVGAATVQAASPPPTGAITNPSANVVVFRIDNNLDKPNRCGGRLEGDVRFSTPYGNVAPRSSIVYTVAAVPAGNYSVRWLCDGFTGPRSLLTVTGVAKPSSEPHLIPNGPTARNVPNGPSIAPRTPRTSPNLFGSLESFNMFSS